MTLTELEYLLQGSSQLPPLERWDPELCGEIDIFVDTDGRWFHEGSPIARESLARLFASILRREADGHHYLVTPAEKMRIRVADVSFVVVDAEAVGEGAEQAVVLSLNSGRKVPLDSNHPLIVQGSIEVPRPYVNLEHGLAARLSRPVYYRLVDRAVEAAGEVGLWSCGVWFALTPPETAS